MNIEYCYFDISSNDAELKDIVGSVLKFPVNCISVLPSYIKSVRGLTPDHIDIACPVDYPLGLLDIKSRFITTEIAIKNGAKIIDAVCPSYLLCNRKYDKFREDIKSLTNLCSQYNVQLRYFLEYRIYSYELLYKIAQILLDFGVSTVMPSTGYLLDDINDNVLASALINKKVPKINIIVNGNIWNQNQISMLQKANLYGLRVNSTNALSLLSNNLSK